MPLAHVTVLSTPAAAGRSPAPDAALITITDPGEPTPLRRFGWGAYLHLSFTDSVYDEVTIRLLEGGFRKVFPGAMTAEHSRVIHAFLDAIEARPAIRTLLVHSRGTTARAIAVARFATERWRLPAPVSRDDANPLVYRLLHEPDAYRSATG